MWNHVELFEITEIRSLIIGMHKQSKKQRANLEGKMLLLKSFAISRLNVFRLKSTDSHVKRIVRFGSKHLDNYSDWLFRWRFKWKPSVYYSGSFFIHESFKLKPVVYFACLFSRLECWISGFTPRTMLSVTSRPLAAVMNLLRNEYLQWESSSSSEVQSPNIIQQKCDPLIFKWFQYET